jgi:hypothetical protein
MREALPLCRLVVGNPEIGKCPRIIRGHNGCTTTTWIAASDLRDWLTPR